MQAQLDELLEKIELLPLNTLDANKVGFEKSSLCKIIEDSMPITVDFLCRADCGKFC
jgi:hypothetical protein